MIEIAMVVCSLIQGNGCHDISLRFADEGQFVISAYACMAPAQAEMAKWKNEHPNFSIARWHCGPAGRYARI